MYLCMFELIWFFYISTCGPVISTFLLRESSSVQQSRCELSKPSALKNLSSQSKQQLQRASRFSLRPPSNFVCEVLPTSIAWTLQLRLRGPSNFDCEVLQTTIARSFQLRLLDPTNFDCEDLPTSIARSSQL